MTEAFYIMALQASLTFVIFACIASWYIAPALALKSLQAGLVPLLLLHSFRIVPLMMLQPGQLVPEFPSDLAQTIAYGDFIAGVLALIAALTLRKSRSWGIAMTWLFTVAGLADMAIVLFLAAKAQVWNLPLGFIYVIPTFYVPILFATHVMILKALTKAGRSA